MNIFSNIDTFVALQKGRDGGRDGGAFVWQQCDIEERVGPKNALICVTYFMNTCV